MLFTMFSRLNQDLRFALRMFRRTPGFTFVAVITITLGIAANVTVFSFIDALFLKELPVKDASRLVRIFGTDRNKNHREFSYSEYANLRDHATTIDQLVTHYSAAPLYVTANGQAGEVQGAVVSANYFPTLGVAPSLGRFFTTQEDAVPDRDAVAVIGYGLWRNWFGADQAVVGKTMRINSRVFQIIGVAPRDFRGVQVGASPNEIWIPAMMLRTGYRSCDAIQDDCTTLSILGRLAPGKTAQQASAEMAALAGQFAAAHRGMDVSEGAWATSAIGAQLGAGDKRRVARLLSVTALALLLIACVNLAGLLMARGTTRAKELAMRLSLGAPRGRILQQLLTESVSLAVVGGALGLMLSLWTNQMLIGFYTTDSEGYAQWFDISLDLGTVLYAAGVSLVTGILFGMLPAFQAARQDTAPVLKSEADSGASQRGRNVLVTCQMALSLALLVGAGLLARSVANIEEGQAFHPQHVALLRLRPRLVGYTPERAQAFQLEVVQRLESLPGVISASLRSGAGFAWAGGEGLRMSLPVARTVRCQEIAPRYFDTLGIPFIQGRDFDDHDRIASAPVTIVSESLAGELWPGESALDRAIVLENKAYRVVGVVKDSEVRSVEQSTVPMAFVSYWQDAGSTDSRMCIRVAGNPEKELGRIKAAIASVDPNVPITEAMPMMAQVRGVFTNVRMAKSVLFCAGGLALLLSGIGLYGVLAFVVGRRTREIGIRMAVGAQPREVMTHFLKQGLLLAALGCTVGLVLAIATTRLLSAFLYGVAVRDPASFLVGAVVLLVVAVAATYLPSRRAARVDPMVALRHE
ncbi:MAG: ABC transporter permease [Bryobacteraceae bacterium]